MAVIERTSPVPYYEQLYGVLLERIQSGNVHRGDRLPGESELHREFGLSRATVRQALELLESTGWANRIPRRGYFASVPPQEEGWLIEGDVGFLDSELGHGNSRVSTKVLSAGEGTLPENAARALKLSGQARGFVLERLRSLDEELVLFSTNFTPPAVSPIVAAAAGVLSGTSALTQALIDGGYKAAGARRVLHALPAPRDVATYLGLAEGTPLLRVRSTTWDKSFVPFDYYETWLRTDRVPIELNTTQRAT